jgi:hypothetical protein
MVAACDPGTGASTPQGGEASQSSALITTRSGSDYANQCAAAGVPLPPPWGAYMNGLEGTGHSWQYRNPKSVTDSYTGFEAADVYYYVATTAPTGVCVIAAHTGPTGAGAFDMICQGSNGKACFWEDPLRSPAAPTDVPIDLVSVLPGGAALPSPTCTTCHAGQNAFITHPIGNHPLNLTGLADWMPSSYFEPLFPRGMPQNSAPLHPEAYPASTSNCTGCHAQGAQAKAGQLPDVTVPAYTGGYCSLLNAIVHLPGSQGGMPPNNTCTNGTCTADSDPFVQALLARCGKGTATSPAVSPVGFERYSGVNPYMGSWDHVVVGKKNDTTSTARLFDNHYTTAFQGWNEVNLSFLSTSFRPTMWAKNDDSSKVAVAATDAWGQVWETQGGTRLVSNTLAGGSPYGYIRHDGWNTIVFRGTDNYIYEAYWSSPNWYTNPLPGQTVRALGDPIGYNRGGSSSVVYKCGASTICEERLINGAWQFRQITTAVPIKGETMPTPFKRDYAEERSVFYAGTDGLHQLIDNTDPSFGEVLDWRINTNTSIVSSPIPYNPQGGGTRVVYITDPGGSSPSALSEAEQVTSGGSWTSSVRVNPPKSVETLVGDPAAYVATSPWRNTIIYRNSANTIYQLQTVNPNSGNVAYAQTIIAKGFHLDTSGTVAANQELRWAFDLPAGHYRYDLTMTSGDVDLYVRLGAPPTTSTYDCRPYLGSTNPEACTTTITNLAGGTVYVMARGWASTSNYAITGNHY